jgi:4-carboxymuconolactone decarboxylase
MTTQRIPFPDPQTLDAATLAQLARRPPAHLYRMVAHAPKLLEPFLSLVVANFGRLSISPAVRESVILRVGAHRHSAYETHHHRRIAREVGLDDATIGLLLTGATVHDLPSELRAPIAMTDALLAERNVEEATLRAVVDAAGTRGYVELALLVGFYGMVATFLAATGVQPEPEGALSGWHPPD